MNALKYNNENVAYLTSKISVQTYHGYSDKWIQFRRGPIYKEYNPKDDLSIEHLSTVPGKHEKQELITSGFQVVNHRRKHKPTYIYYWYLHAHNLYPFDILKSDDTNSKIVKPWSKFKKYTLYFCEPDSEIYPNDSYPQVGIDKQKTNPVLSTSKECEVPSTVHAGASKGCEVPLLFYAKHDGIKFKPITFIARTEEQIKESLRHIKYCVVKEVGLDKLEIVSDDDIRKEYVSTQPPC